MAWSFNLGVNAVPSGNTQTTFQANESINGTPMLIRVIGTGLTFDANGFPTGGTLNSMTIVDPTTGGAGTTVQTVTFAGGLPAANFGSYINTVRTYGLQIQGDGTPGNPGWGFQFIEQPAIFTSNQITLFGANGETLVITGSGFIDGSFQGTVTSITHYNAGSTVLHQITGLNISLYAGAGALGADEAAYTYLTQGTNTVTLNSANYQWLELDGGLGADTITGLPSTGNSLTYNSDATSGVIVNLTTNSVSGGGGADTISNINNVRGSSFGDQLTGNANANTLDGNEGNDTLSGLAGNDFLIGGDGNDQLNGGDSGDTLNGGADNLFGGAGNDTLNGGAGDNHLNGGGDADTFVFTREGSGTFVHDFGMRVFEAYVSGDSIVPTSVSTNADGFLQIQLNRAQNAAQIFLNVNNLDVNGNQTSGTTADNVVSIALRAGNATQNGLVVYGLVAPNSDLDGDLQINPYVGQVGGFYQTVWDGSEGNGTTLAAQIAALAAGNIYLDIQTVGRPGGEIRGQLQEIGSGNADKIDLTALNIGSMSTLNEIMSDDNFNGARIFTQLNSVQSQMFIQGMTESQFTASDFIFTTANTNDNIVGTGGMDDLFGAAGNDTLDGSGGSDRLFGEDGNDTMIGGSGNDTMIGGLGTDNLNGGDNDDIIYATHDDGVDTITGGNGFDILDFSQVNGVVQINQLAGTITGSAGNDVLADVIEQIKGTAFNDVLSGGHGINVLDGEGGNDQFFGNNGDDLMRGGTGDDTFFFSTNDGNDTLLGGDGFDILDYSTLGGVVQINQLAGTTTGTANNDTLADIFEMVIGSAFDDVLSGGHGGNSLKGNAGNDQFFANNGDDYMSGGTGNDTLTGGVGSDTQDVRNGENVDTWLDFTAGGTEDTITLTFYSGLGITTFAQLEASGRLSTVSGHAELALNGGDKIIFNNVASHLSLTAADFIF